MAQHSFFGGRVATMKAHNENNETQSTTSETNNKKIPCFILQLF